MGYIFVPTVPSTGTRFLLRHAFKTDEHSARWNGQPPSPKNRLSKVGNVVFTHVKWHDGASDEDVWELALRAQKIIMPMRDPLLAFVTGDTLGGTMADNEARLEGFHMLREMTARWFHKAHVIPVDRPGPASIRLRRALRTKCPYIDWNTVVGASPHGKLHEQYDAGKMPDVDPELVTRIRMDEKLTTFCQFAGYDNLRWYKAERRTR